MRSASGYERELKDLLQGDPESVRRYAQVLPPAERPVFEQVLDHPFLVVRAAGSNGFDLVALRKEFAFPLEVKASSSSTIHFTAASGRAASQLEEHRKNVDRVGLAVLYAFRKLGHRGGDPWRLFTPPAPAATGIVGLLRKRIPLMSTTRSGNAVLRWDEGMPLVRFVELVAGLVGDAPVAR
ncbi:MAG TPA: Holliday junction resolvase [Thermoplasmata archaeon]|nr:Holliday junction resolvase [Thermoplasmata archaeon]